jgi:uncharacterized membrane protein YeiH
MQSILEHLGVAVAALTGVLAARGKRVDLFGVLVLALVTAFGGGTIRDLALGDRPVFWVRDSSFAITASATALAAFFVARMRQFPQNVLLVADAGALSFFTAIGAEKALAFQAAPHIAVAMGVITGVAGGMCRDVLTGEIPLVFRREIYLYATAAAIGAACFVVLQSFAPNRSANLIAGTVTTLALRLAAIRWRLGLPVFDEGPGRDPQQGS